MWQRIYQGVTHFFYSSLLAAASFSASPANGLLGLGPSVSAAFLLSAFALASAASLSRLCWLFFGCPAFFGDFLRFFLYYYSTY